MAAIDHLDAALDQVGGATPSPWTVRPVHRPLR
jgi:hypothetical protein